MAKDEQRISFFNLDNDFTGGGYFTPGLYEILEASFVIWDYKGKSKDSVALRLKLKSAADGKESEQYWSAGDPQFFVPTSDGNGLKAVGKRATLTDSCNFFQFMKELRTAGYPMDEYDNNISVLEGLVAEFDEIPAPSRDGLDRTAPDGQQQRAEKKIIVVKSIPDQKAAKKAASKGAAAPAPVVKGKAKPKDDELDAETLLAEYITDVLCTDANKKGIQTLQARVGIGKFVTGKGGDADMAKSVVALFNDTDQLGSFLTSAGWQLDGKTIKPE